MIQNFNKFPYPELRQDTFKNKRLYLTPEGNHVPSVTTILSKTKDTTGLDKWAKSIGIKKANKIRDEAAFVGTSMHTFLEENITGVVREAFTPSPLHTQAKQMANVIVEEGLKFIDEVWGAEVRLYHSNIYAGTTDVVGSYKGVPHIIDFKQTNKPKKEEWVQDYYLQLCAYAHAHNDMFGTDFKNGVVLMCSRDLQFQKFELNEIQFEKYSYMWWNRVEQYKELAQSDSKVAN